MKDGLLFIDNSLTGNEENTPDVYTKDDAKSEQQNRFCQEQYSVLPDFRNADLLQNLCQQNNQTIQGIAAANQLLGQNVVNVTGEMLKTMHSLQRENARKKKGKVLKTDEDGFIAVCQHYDDGTEKIIEILSYELYEPIEVYRLVVPEELKAMTEILEIRTGDGDYVCHVPLKKGWPRELYHAMLHEGIKFSPEFKEAEIRAFLERMLAPRIDQAKRLIINHLSGWDCKEERFVQGPVWQNWKINCPLPRDRKMLNGTFSADSLKEYVQYLLGIKNERVRLMLWIYPFLGLSDSLLEKNGLSFQGILNLVVPDSASIQNAAAFFLQTYLRNKPGRLSVTDKSLGKCLGEAKDEVLVLQSSDEGSSYYKEKQKQMLKCIAGFSRKEQELPFPYNRELLGTICLLSKKPADGAKVIHLYADDDFSVKVPKLGTQDRDVMQDVWCGYIEWICRNWESTQILIQNAAKECSGNEEAVFEAVFCLAERYFETLGLDSFCRKIGLLSKPEFGMFFSEKPERESVNCFVSKMRKIIQGYFVQDIRSDRSCPENNETFFYDSASIYIVKQQFELLLEEMEIESKQELLARLLEENMLVTNTDRYYFSLQLSGKRFRTVKLRLELFEKTGDVNILYLGKEKS